MTSNQGIENKYPERESNTCEVSASSIAIGDFIITQMLQDIYIYHKSGEGMQVDKKKFSKAIVKFYKENF